MRKADGRKEGDQWRAVGLDELYHWYNGKTWKLEDFDKHGFEIIYIRMRGSFSKDPIFKQEVVSFPLCELIAPFKGIKGSKNNLKLPNRAVVEIDGDVTNFKKLQETLDKVFHTYPDLKRLQLNKVVLKKKKGGSKLTISILNPDGLGASLYLKELDGSHYGSISIQKQRSAMGKLAGLEANCCAVKSNDLIASCAMKAAKQ